MSTYPLTRPRSRKPAAAVFIFRLAVGMLLAGAGVCLIVFEHSGRELESMIGAFVIGHTVGIEAIDSFIGTNPTIAYHLGDHWYALQITPECSAFIYLGAIFILAAIFAAIPRYRLGPLALALLLSSSILLLLNQVRFMGLAWVLGTYGKTAFDWAHSLGGSFLMMGGLAASLLIFFLLVVRDGSPRKRRAAS